MPTFETMLTQEQIDRFTKQGLWRDRIITDDLDEDAVKFPSRLAVVDSHQQYTYAQLKQLVDRCALGLLDFGVQPGDVVAFQLPNWSEFLIVHYAATRIGAISCPLTPIYRDREIGFMLELAEAKVLVIPKLFNRFDYTEMVERLWPSLPHLESVFVIGDEAPKGMHVFRELTEDSWEEKKDPRTLAFLRPDPNAVTELIFTSGTTGEPKGVLHTHNTLMAANLAMAQRLGLTSDSVIHMASTFAHQTGFLYGARMPTQLGATGVYQDVWNPQEFVRLVERYKITVTTGATPFLHDILNLDDLLAYDLRSFTRFACIGAPIPRSLLRKARTKLPNTAVVGGWGQTEDALVTLSKPDDPEEKVTQTDGFPLEGMEIRVVDNENQLLPPAQEGRLQCRGAFLFVGYAKRLKMTKENFVEDWFDTGDLASIDQDGYVSLAGRVKDIIIRGGENIPVTYVENILHEHPKIDDVAIVAMPDPRLQERACAFVILKPGTTLTFEEMQAFLAEKGVTKQYWPERLEIIDEFPRTPSGKIQKFILRDQVAREMRDK